MFLSFIIPIYNASLYLEECISSCCTQDIPISEYEIICVNDGSTDDSAEILRCLSVKYPNITVINQENGGVSKARNKGMEVAKGDYIWFVDADDIIRKNCLAKLRGLVYEQQIERLAFRYYRFSNESEEELNAWLLDPNHRTGGGYDNMVWPNLFSREFLIRENARFETDISYGEDTLFVFRLQLAKPREFYSSEPFYYWRQHSNSATKQQTEQMKLSMIRSYFCVAAHVRKSYDLCSSGDMSTKQFIADKALMLELKGLEQLAQLELPAYSQMLRELQRQG